ncbi:dirigent protein 15-like [Lotus japonicus]|uniref:dirigent protein 15-like n=1 Tax=Lotus japonicus TaxID=34305 RepID=UPI00258966BA|nr:dirigent protein 15-like [Lotus japonicus]
MVAGPNQTGGTHLVIFSTSVYANDNLLREGIEETSKVIGNVLTSSELREKVVLVMNADFSFTFGKLNGSSISKFSIFSRNPVSEPTRELEVVGQRKKFRMASCFYESKIQPVMGLLSIM